MSAKSWYALTSKAVPTRYGLSNNIQILLQALDQHKCGSIDDIELGRLVRLSPKRRAAIANTISKCATLIKKEPDEVKTCVDVIEMCTEILEIADRYPPTQGFPFMRLPLEIRDRILNLMVDTTYRSKRVVPVAKSRLSCSCPKYDKDALYMGPQIKVLPALLGPKLVDEFSRVFFRKKIFRFRCSCELLLHLRQNALLRENVRHISVHWCGADAAEAFKELPKCPSFTDLTVGVSKLTLTHLNERANLLKNYFPLPYRHIRFTDALGFDELLDIRGLREVDVSHALPRSAALAVEMDRACLADLLSTKLTAPKDL